MVGVSRLMLVLLFASATAQQCSMSVKPNWCIEDVTGYKFPAVTSSDGCCAACAADNVCQSWTFSKGKGEYQVHAAGPSGPCHLKNATAPGQPGKGCSMSGSKTPFPAPTPAPAPAPPTPAPVQPTPAPQPAPAGALNVLFIMIDDLRPEFNQAYWQDLLVTPHLDKFAASSLTFDRAYVQYSHCSPSRNSFMSGRSPQTTGVYNFIDHFREKGVGADWTSMPEHFKKHGYYVSGGGKIYHPNKPPNNDMPLSWDNYYKPNGDDHGCRSNETIYTDVCPSDEPDDAFYDNVLAKLAVEEMAKAKAMTKPFFM